MIYKNNSQEAILALEKQRLGEDRSTPSTSHITCLHCRERITEGEYYYDCCTGSVCLSCLTDMSAYDFIKLTGDMLLIR